MKPKSKNSQSGKKYRPTEKAMEIISLKQPHSDPQGSYTGVCKKEYETPVQDADDL